MESLLAGFAPSHGVHCRYAKAVDGKRLQVLDVIGGIVAWRYDFFCCVPCSTYSRSENNRPLVVSTVRVNMSDDLKGKSCRFESFCSLSRFCLWSNCTRVRKFWNILLLVKRICCAKNIPFTLIDSENKRFQKPSVSSYVYNPMNTSFTCVKGWKHRL